MPLLRLGLDWPERRIGKGTMRSADQRNRQRTPFAGSGLGNQYPPGRQRVPPSVLRSSAGLTLVSDDELPIKSGPLDDQLLITRYTGWSARTSPEILPMVHAEIRATPIVAINQADGTSP